MILFPERPRSHADRWPSLAHLADYRVESLAGALATSERHMHRLCRRELGQSPKEWLREQRMAAARLLLNRGSGVKAVAMELGFKRVAHFSREFKQWHGVTATRFAADFKQAD